MSHTAAKQVGKFGVVGIFNTLLDIAILNILSLVVGVPRIPANIISTSIAMLCSFELNRRFVFESKGKERILQALKFLSFTAFGLYVLQSGTIYLLTEIWTWPTELAFTISQWVYDFNEEFVTLNTAKAAATLVSMTWNFLTYKKFVFKK